jgi:hypothetical protein
VAFVRVERGAEARLYPFEMDTPNYGAALTVAAIDFANC